MKKLISHMVIYLVSALILLLTVYAPVAFATEDDFTEQEREERMILEQERADVMGADYIPSESFINEQERMDMEAAAGNASADDHYIQWELLVKKWEQDGYPDDIGGVYYDNDAGTMGFLLVNFKPERIGELRLLVSDNAIITPCLYSYNELRQAQSEIDSIMSADSGIYSTGVGWTSSTDGRVHGFGESGKEFRLEVRVDGSVYDHYYAGFTELYGDRVIVRAIDPSEMPMEAMAEDGAVFQKDDRLTDKNGTTYERGIIVPVDIGVALAGSVFNITAASTIPLYQNNWIFTAILILLCGVAITVYINRACFIPVMQTNTGRVVTGNAKINRRQIITVIKNSALIPSDDVFKIIMEKIEMSIQGDNE